MKWRIVLFAIGWGLVSVGLQAGAWPQFRGPTGEGIAEAKDLPIKWGEGRNIAWKTAVPGEGWSSPVISDGSVFLTSAIEEGPLLSYRLLRFDTATGNLHWEVEIFRQDPTKKARIHRKNSHASPTPILESGRIYTHFGHQGTACLNREGEVIWQNRSFDYNPVHGSGGSPVIVDNALIFSCDGAEDPFVAALNKQTGEVLWKTPRRSGASRTFSFSTPLVIDVQGQKQVISPGSDLVAAYDPNTGDEIWRVQYRGYSVVPRPVYGHGLVFISTGFDRATAMAIRPNGQGDVTDTHVAWKTSRSVPKTPSMLLVEDKLYMISNSGMASCRDAKTGKLHWQKRLEGNFSASPIYVDGKIYALNEMGTGIVLRASTDFEVIARNPLNERTLASYAVLDNALFIRSTDHLYRIQKDR